MAGIKKGSGRWATIVKDTGEVSTIANMEGDVPPETRNESKDQFEVVEVDEGVAVGMVKSGNGFEWPQGREPGASDEEATSDKSRGNKAPKEEAKDDKPTPQPEDMKPKPAEPGQ